MSTPFGAQAQKTIDRETLDHLFGLLQQVSTVPERIELFYEFMTRNGGSCMTLSGVSPNVFIELLGVEAEGVGCDLQQADKHAIANWLYAAVFKVALHG